MAQTFVENKICGVCGADVRPNALFCYNCGGAITVETKAEEKSPEKPFVYKIKKEKVKKEKVKKEPEQTVFDEKTEQKVIVADAEIKEPEKDKNLEAEPKRELKSAASLRRKSKSLERKIVEVVWEEHENAPNVWFISVAVVLAIVAAVILFLAMYLK
ncbi:MAG TPA: zinc ribbon domain-containing protein [Pyrinomonadaceae bacterium]|nr:zinc ribbon domain-containing protein [Pyrinomonadaceae bacterium]